jgi:diguanylate cyclase (GGDEF)-like protein
MPNVTGPNNLRERTGDAEDRRIRRSWLVFAGSFLILGLLAVFKVWFDHSRSDWIIAGLIVIVGFAAVRHRLAVQALEADRRIEAESFARILQGLSRSVSPDAIVDAIVEEIGHGTGADHIVVARRRPDTRVLEATLVNARTGGPSSSTLFPISDLEDPPTRAEVLQRESIGIPIEVGESVAQVPRVATPVGARPVGPPEMPALAALPPLNPSSTGDLFHVRSRPADGTALVAERIAARAREVYGLKYTMAAPLMTDSGVIGAIVVSRRTSGPWPASAQRILAGSAVEASAALSRAYSHREAEARASTDALTGLPNRRYFDEFCALLSRRRRSKDGLGILMVDIDRFKLLNDTHGHAVGDEVLRSVAGAIASAVREDDVPARYGGEEFAVLLRNPSRDEAFEVGERIREAVSGLDLSRLGVPATSVSVGVAVATVPDQPVLEIIAHADRALYAAKHAGRDRVVAA